MANTVAERYRAALEEIVQVGTTPDTTVIGTLPGGGVGTLWSVGGQDRAFEQIIKIAKAALEQT